MEIIKALVARLHTLDDEPVLYNSHSFPWGRSHERFLMMELMKIYSKRWEFSLKALTSPSSTTVIPFPGMEHGSHKRFLMMELMKIFSQRWNHKSPRGSAQPAV
jgi:hypothetical protein